jgi:hypothetical protein
MIDAIPCGTIKDGNLISIPLPTDPNSVKLIWIFTAILLPLLPAILLFKFLPASQAKVWGPFKGLKINLSGSIAAYFLLFIAISFGPRPTPPSAAEIWRIKGSIRDENGKILGADKINVNIQPNTVEYRNDGSFDMKVLVKRNEMGQLEMPTLNVLWNPPDPFGNAIVHLDPADLRVGLGEDYKLERDESAHEIVVTKPIKLEKKVADVPYSPPTGPAPQPTALPPKLADPTPTPSSTHSP